jgi:phosphatidylserine/phosphatidylglycerophosphate/cardiolipin synthase-like enzyme
VNAFIYDEGIARSLKQAFIDDMKVSDQLTKGDKSCDIPSLNLIHKLRDSYFSLVNWSETFISSSIARSLKQAFIDDMKVSDQLTKEKYESRSLWIKFKEGISQLFTSKFSVKLLWSILAVPTLATSSSIINVLECKNHSKTLIIDDEVASVGTANMDHRSFTLNFEVNAFIYDEGETSMVHIGSTNTCDFIINN